MSRPRLLFLALAAVSVCFLGDMRGDEGAKVPERLLKAVGGKSAKATPAKDPKVAAKPDAKEKAAGEEKVEAKAAPAEEKGPEAKAAPEAKGSEIKAARLTPKQIAFVKNELLPAYQSG